MDNAVLFLLLGEPVKPDENGEMKCEKDAKFVNEIKGCEGLEKGEEKDIKLLEEDDLQKEPKSPLSPVGSTHSQDVPAPPSPVVVIPEQKIELVTFNVIHNKQKYEVDFPLDDSVSKLKLHLQSLIGIPQNLQKVMYKGLAKDDKTLRDIGVTSGAKVMVVGSKLDDVLAVSTPSTQVLNEEKSAGTSKEPFCKQKNHKRVLDRGIPDDVMPGILNTKEPLPPCPLSGMLNKSGGKVRLTFKLELDQLWIGTKDRTEKVPMSTIKTIVSEPIEGHEQYHIMGFQLGTTESSRYWVYWVPAQYIDSIKDAVLGPWGR
ncbi:ubiquitin domain-containing protein UBFD1-like isoform X2 [Cimex lectularius]|uniref:Ubiquitin-like domain-containing protein n=1 Tax=Cimex lectularius TaxID=79782 RepID=A0A8I6SVF0_CIMLE|nr:ubiquitin domain-containing protein UBFD1-like isoform X2 [Cimex lectularius]